MSIYKKRIYASSILIVFLLLFISAGYYFTSKKSLQQEHLKQASSLLNETERQSFLISGYILSLSNGSKMSPVKYIHQSEELKVASNSLKISFSSFNKLLNEKVSFSKVGGSDFQLALNKVNLNSNNFIRQVETISSLPQNNYLPQERVTTEFIAAELELRKDFAGLSKLLVKENEYIELHKNNMKMVILGTLMICLVITLLLVTPLIRLSIIANKKLENELLKAKKSEALLSRIIDTSPDLIFILNNQHKYERVNKTLAQHMNLSPEDFIGKDDIELGIFKHSRRHGNALEIKKRKENDAVLATGKNINILEESLMINGMTRIHSTTKLPLKDEKGKIWGLLGRSRDITDSIKKERLIFDSEKKYRHLFMDNPLPMWILDRVTFRFLEVNKEATKLYGYSEKEFLSLTIFDILPIGEKTRVVQIFKHIASGHSSFKKRKTCNHINKNGENIFVDVDANTFDFNGKQTFFFSVKDVTGTIELQKQFVIEKVNHQKEITKTVIATQEKERAEIAKELHDNVNQILSSAKLHIECIQSNNEDIHRQTSIELIKSGIQEIRKLSTSIISPSLNQVGLVHSINELLNNIRSTSYARVEFNHETFVEDSMDPDLELTIFRIIQEQTTNILKYADATIVKVELGLYEDYLQLIITDNGIGFNTTNAHKGVGFTNIMNRAQIHNGNFKLTTSPGNGCSLRVDFKLNIIPKNIPLLHSA